MRLIIVSFLFMGWAFYELSGGADFQPRVKAQAPPEAASQSAQPTQPPQAIVVPTTPARRQIEVTGLVATPAIAPAEPESNAEPETPPETALTDTAQAQPLSPGLDRLRTGLGQGLSLFPEAGPEQSLTLASLEAGAAGLATAPVASDATTAQDPAAQPAEPPADIREVTGTRVNMRDGPGTIYPVIARLTIGRKVEVLGNSGTGWLRLRTLSDRQIGWIAASLISKP